MVIGLAPAAHAASAYDNVIQLDSSLVLNGNDVSTSYYSDIKTWSTNHPEDTGLADAVAAWDDAMDAGAGWALLKCPEATCGGGGYGQIVISPSTSYYSFFHESSAYRPSVGVRCADATCSEVYQIAFRYNSSGVMVSAGAGAAATGTLSDGTDYYVGFSYYSSNPGISSRTVYVNAPIFYPSGYEGVWVPTEYTPPPPALYSGTVDCGVDTITYMQITQDGITHDVPLTYESAYRASWSDWLTSTPYTITVGCGLGVAASFGSVTPMPPTSNDWICDTTKNPRYCVLS